MSLGKKEIPMKHRIVNVIINLETLARFVRNDKYVYRVSEGVPADAKPVGVSYSPETRNFHITFEHESFNEVPQGTVIPEERTIIEVLKGP